MHKVRQCHPVSPNPITDQWTAGAGIHGRYKIGFACLPVRLLVNLGLTAPSSFCFLIMTCTKSTLGRVWARYYNWYGMTEKLRAALLQHGWMEERIKNYDRVNHSTVNLEHEWENPKVPAPNDSAWLKNHKLLPGRAKQAKPLHKKGTAQPAGEKKP